MPKAATVEVMTPHFGKLPTETIVHQTWEKLMSEKTGCDITFKFNYVPYAEYSEKQNIALASGDFPDMISVMDKKLTDPYEDQDIFVELSQYKDLTPNYLKYVDSIEYGRSKVENSDGEYYGFLNVENPRLTQGIGIYTTTAYRYDIFQKENIEIPKTTEEFYQAATKLKTAYPDKFPVSRGKGNAWASFETLTFKTADEIFWDGSEYKYGPTTENYKDMLTYLNKLYSEKLLDPESLTEDSDAHTKKALNGTNFMQMGEWFTTSHDWNLNKESNVQWVNALSPSDEKYGKAWQSVSNVNESNLGAGLLTINSDSENIDLIVKICDLQYTDDVIELVTWGIEGESFTRTADGTPTFVDEIKNADNPWAAGDKWGMRASAGTRPGLQLAIDTRAFIDFAPNDPCYLDGKLVEMPWEKAFPNEKWRESELISPNVFAPPLSFTTEEAQSNSTVMTAVQTMVDEYKIKFIKGDEPLANWDKYVKSVTDMGYQAVVDLYNTKAAALEK